MFLLFIKSEIIKEFLISISKKFILDLHKNFIFFNVSVDEFSKLSIKNKSKFGFSDSNTAM